MTQWHARCYTWGIRRIYRFHIDVQGLENIPKSPSIFIANHQHALDMAVFGTVFPAQTVAVFKSELFWIPFFGLLAKLSGSIFVKRGSLRARAMIPSCQKALEEGTSIWIFPEGTRNKSPQLLLPFKKGAFHLALASQAPIVPICASRYTAASLLKGTIHIQILPPIHPHNSVEATAKDAHNAMQVAVRRLSP